MTLLSHWVDEVLFSSIVWRSPTKSNVGQLTLRKRINETDLPEMGFRTVLDWKKNRGTILTNLSLV